MPASPAMRISPGRELRLENHKRGHSLESSILHREKEDDLALFNDVQRKEGEDFLLQSNDNFDDIFSTKSRLFSDYNLGISIPTRGQGSELLNAEEDKNDYDWLITPPETPLFRSLDDETPPVNLAPRGRPRSQPVPISRSPTMEKGYRTGRGSASPQRLSPSPRSRSSTLQSRSGPFSATHSSPPSTPSRRLSPPPSKPVPAPRSNTPPDRRKSTGSAGTAVPSGVRGTSPVNKNRGNSPSPKAGAWQSSIPGFSSEAPPNLRTSLADRPASYLRGSSPASKNSSRYGRKSMSPTASRSVSSPHSPFSYHSRGSATSSGDDDVDSLHSFPISSSDQSAPRSIGAYPSYSAVSFSKKPTKSLSSSAPKRSFELVRQMDRKGPQNMFRPLLSSVPSSTIHVGKASGRHHSLTSRNSSITTSSNASSDQATSGAHDTEESEQNQEDVTSDSVKGHYPDLDDEVFDREQVDALGGDIENRIVEDPLGARHGETDSQFIVGSTLGVDEGSNQLDTTTVIMLDKNHDCSYADGIPDMVICSKCRLMFHSVVVVAEGDLPLCLECKSLEANLIITNPGKKVIGENYAADFAHSSEHGSLEVLDQSASTPESLKVTCTGESAINHLNKIADLNQLVHSDSSHILALKVIEKRLFPTQPVIKQLMEGDTNYQQLQHTGINSIPQVNDSKFAGISLLLKRSNSVKGHIVQSRSVTASNTSYDDFSYSRDSINSMRSSIDQSSASLSSSVDLESSRQTETRVHRQSSGQKSDIENYRHEMPTKHKCSVSSISGASGDKFQVPNYHEDNFQLIASHMDREFREESCTDPHELSLASEYTELESTCTSTASELSSHLMNVHENAASRENGDELTNNSCNPMDEETSSVHPPTSKEEDNRVDSDGIPNASSLDAISEIEIENGSAVIADLHSDELQQNDFKTSTLEEFGISYPAYVVPEEPRVLMEDMGETKARSLTLEEATDAILFCSSIVHNLANEAANSAIDNETPTMEVLRPTVKFVGGPDSERRDTRSRTTRKRSFKSQKARQKRLEEMETKPPRNAETNAKSSPHIVGTTPNNGESMNPPKLESKCNCIIM